MILKFDWNNFFDAGIPDLCNYCVISIICNRVKYWGMDFCSTIMVTKWLRCVVATPLCRSNIRTIMRQWYWEELFEIVITWLKTVNRITYHIPKNYTANNIWLEIWLKMTFSAPASLKIWPFKKCTNLQFVPKFSLYFFIFRHCQDATYILLFSKPSNLQKLILPEFGAVRSSWCDQLLWEVLMGRCTSGKISRWNTILEPNKSDI